MSRLLALATVVITSLTASAQTPLQLVESKEARNVDGSVTITKRYLPAQTAVPVQVFRYAPAPVLYAVPVMAAKAPVGEYRTGLLGLRRNVVNADGTMTHYGPLGRKR